MSSRQSKKKGLSSPARPSLPSRAEAPEPSLNQLQSALKEKEELLSLFRSSEERLRSLMECTAEAVFCLELHPPVPTDLSIDDQVQQIQKGILVECNEACLRDQDLRDPKEFLGKDLSAAFGIPSNTLEELWRGFEKTGYQRFETQIDQLGQDGIDYTFSVSLMGVMEGSHLVRVWGSYIDITERIRAEKLLRIQRDLSVDLGQCTDPRRMAELVLTAALQIDTVHCGGVYLRDPQKGGLDLVYYEGLSDNFAQLVYHYDSSSPQWSRVRTGKPAYLHSSELQEELRAAAVQEALHAACVMPISYENETIGAINLASRTHDTFPAAIKVAVEGITGMVGGALIRALSERRTQEALAKLRAVMESPSDIAIFSVDRSLSYIAFNDAHRREMRSLFGMEIAPGVGFMDILQSSPLKEQVGPNFQRALQGETLTALCSDKELGVFYQMTLSPILNPEGEADGISAFVQNVTRRIMERKERMELQDRLRQSEKLEAVGQLAGGIAHDFNNQLASIRTHAEVMKELIPSYQELLPYVDDILLASKRAQDLTAHLLAFARKGPFLSRPVDVHQCVREVISLLKRSLNKQILIWEDLRATNSLILGDSSQLQNALLNLALNARDAMPQGGDLRFTTLNCEGEGTSQAKGPVNVPPGDYVYIAVSDTGTGIPSKLQKRVFEPFFTTKEHGQGTGMGLAAVYGTVRSHKGFLQLSSEMGRGTSVDLYLPCLQGDPASEKIQTPLQTLMSGSGHILLVDDEEILLKATSNALMKLGYGVTPIQAGPEAVAYYKDHWQEIDLVLLDLIMPTMGGRDVFLALREINPQVLVLIFSGYSVDGTPEDLMNEGVRGVLNKPFSLAELSQKIATLLESH